MTVPGRTERFAINDGAIAWKVTSRLPGGVKFLHSAEGGYTHESATKDVKHMLSRLDGLLSLTLADDTLYVGSANGHLYAVSIR